MLYFYFYNLVCFVLEAFLNNLLKKYSRETCAESKGNVMGQGSKGKQKCGFRRRAAWHGPHKGLRSVTCSTKLPPERQRTGMSSSVLSVPHLSRGVPAPTPLWATCLLSVEGNLPQRDSGFM